MSLTPLPNLVQMLQMDPAIQRLMGQTSQQDQAMQDILNELAKRAAAATAAVGPAQAALTQATNAPLPQPGPGDIIAQLGGDIGTAISGSPRFAARAEAGVAGRQSQRLMQRQEQLSILHDELARRSSEALNAGNLEVATKIQTTLGRISRLQDQVGKQIEAVTAQGGLQANERFSQRSAETATNVEKMRAQAAIDVANINAGRTSAQTGIDPKTGFMLRDFYVKERNQAAMLARNPKTNQDAARQALLSVDMNRLVGETPEDMANRLKRLRDPFNRGHYLITGAPVNRLFGAGKRAESPETDDAIYQILQQFFTPQELADANARAAGKARPQSPASAPPPRRQ